MNEEWFSILKDAKNFDRYKDDIKEALKHMKTLLDTEYPNKANLTRLTNLTKDISGAIKLLNTMVDEVDEDKRVEDEKDPSRKRVLKWKAHMVNLVGNQNKKEQQEVVINAGKSNNRRKNN